MRCLHSPVLVSLFFPIFSHHLRTPIPPLFLFLCLFPLICYFLLLSLSLSLILLSLSLSRSILFLFLFFFSFSVPLSFFSLLYFVFCFFVGLLGRRRCGVVICGFVGSPNVFIYFFIICVCCDFFFFFSIWDVEITRNGRK